MPTRLPPRGQTPSMKLESNKPEPKPEAEPQPQPEPGVAIPLPPVTALGGRPRPALIAQDIAIPLIGDTVALETATELKIGPFTVPSGVTLVARVAELLRVRWKPEADNASGFWVFEVRIDESETTYWVGGTQLLGHWRELKLDA